MAGMRQIARLIDHVAGTAGRSEPTSDAGADDVLSNNDAAPARAAPVLIRSNRGKR